MIYSRASREVQIYKFHLNSWYGRFGNNLIQLSNAIYVARQTNSILTFTAHSVIKNCVFDFSNGNKNLKQVSSNFWNLTTFEKVNLENLYTQRSSILKKYILPLLPYIPQSNEYDLVVHFRGGDIFTNPHPSYVQMPLSYFLKIFKKENASNILLVCEDSKNPVISKLLESQFNCHYQSGTIYEDINYILNAPVLVLAGITTFSEFLSLCSEKIKKIYYPICEKEFVNRLRYIASHEIIDVHCDNYIKMGHWRANPEQLRRILTHPVDKIYLKGPSNK